MEPSNPPTYYTIIYIGICRLHTNQHYLLAHATHVCSPQEHNIDGRSRVTSGQRRQSPLTTYEDVITSRAVYNTVY